MDSYVASASEFSIAGRTLDEWQTFARRDDCLNQMVPSDLRMLIAQIRQDQSTARVLAEALERAANNRDMWKGQCQRQAETLAAARARWASIVEDILGDGMAARFVMHAVSSAEFELEGYGRTLSDATPNPIPKEG
jgi:hypothetical protein